jgi:hypothetical protein
MDKPDIQIQSPTIHDLDRAMIRRALMEVFGLFLLAIALMITWFLFAPPSWENLWRSIVFTLVVELVILGFSFILKEPAIERIAKAIIAIIRERVANRRIQTVRNEPVADLATASTNQANEDFHTALRILDASLKELSKLKDGEMLKGKPFTWDRCQKAKLSNRWQDWGRVMDLWSAAGVADKPRERDGRLVVKTFSEGREKLRVLMIARGYTLYGSTGGIGGEWRKR